MLDWWDALDAAELLDSTYVDCIPHLLQALEDPDEYVRLSAVTALRAVGVATGDTLQAVCRLAADRNPYVQQEVVAYLSHHWSVDERVSVNALVTICRDWHSYVGTRLRAYRTVKTILQSHWAVIKRILLSS